MIAHWHAKVLCLIRPQENNINVFTVDARLCVALPSPGSALCPVLWISWNASHPCLRGRASNRYAIASRTQISNEIAHRCADWRNEPACSGRFREQSVGRLLLLFFSKYVNRANLFSYHESINDRWNERPPKRFISPHLPNRCSGGKGIHLPGDQVG